MIKEILFAAGYFIGGFCGYLVGYSAGAADYQSQAIKAGVAEYALIDPSSSQTIFRFKTISQL